MTRRSRPLGDEVLVRRAARGLALQVAGLVALAMLLLVVLVTVVVVRGQSSATDALLRSTLTSADDVGDPPPGAWLVLGDGGPVQASPGLPAGLTGALARLRAAPVPDGSLRDLAGADGRDYRVATQVRGGRSVQVVLDLTGEHRLRSLLFRAMGVASLLALAFAAVLGVLLGRRAVRPLAAALTLQRAFVADASHELRAPLTLLSTRAQLLDRAVRAGGLDARVLDDSRGVVHDVQRLGEVVEDLLVAADPGGRESHLPTDLAPLVAAVVDSARAHAEQAAVLLGCDLPPGEAAWVRGAAPALRRAVLSLVDNAIDHAPAGGRVVVRMGTGRGTVTVTVSDTGPGIAPKAAQDVLRRFHSGSHRAGRVHYGLGLALSHDVANRHGGQLTLLPSAVGATFQLALPALEGALPPKSEPAPRNSQESRGTL